MSFQGCLQYRFIIKERSYHRPKLTKNSVVYVNNLAMAKRNSKPVFTAVNRLVVVWPKRLRLYLLVDGADHTLLFDAIEIRHVVLIDRVTLTHMAHGKKKRQTGEAPCEAYDSSWRHLYRAASE